MLHLHVHVHLYMYMHVHLVQRTCIFVTVPPRQNSMHDGRIFDGIIIILWPHQSSNHSHNYHRNQYFCPSCLVCICTCTFISIFPLSGLKFVSKPGWPASWIWTVPSRCHLCPSGQLHWPSSEQEASSQLQLDQDCQTGSWQKDLAEWPKLQWKFSKQKAKELGQRCTRRGWKTYQLCGVSSLW